MKIWNANTCSPPSFWPSMCSAAACQCSRPKESFARELPEQSMSVSICNWHDFFSSFFLVIFVIIYNRCCCCCWEPNHLWEFFDLFLSCCNPFICLCFCLVCINKYLNQYHHIYRPINFIFTTTCTDQIKSKQLHGNVMN